MVYQTIFEANKTSILGIWSYVNEITTIFTPLLIFGLWIIAFLGSYYSQIRTRGNGDILGSFAVANIFIAIVSVVMSLSPEPIINIPTVLICITLAIIGVAILLMQNNND
jgi:hypothetical protein